MTRKNWRTLRFTYFSPECTIHLCHADPIAAGPIVDAVGFCHRLPHRAERRCCHYHGNENGKLLSVSNLHLMCVIEWQSEFLRQRRAITNRVCVFVRGFEITQCSVRLPSPLMTVWIMVRPLGTRVQLEFYSGFLYFKS